MQKEAVRKDAVKKPNLNFERDKKREKVTGIFRYHEVPGGWVGFSFREFKGDPIERYDLVDGETYTIPLGVAKHLNKNGWYPVYGYAPQEGPIKVQNSPVPASNSQAVKISQKVRRFSFQSLEFIDIDDVPGAERGILEVQTV